MRRIGFLVVCLIVFAPETASAGFIASYTSDGSAFGPFVINVGQTVDVPLYLIQTDTNTELTTGLLSAGIGIDFAPTGIANASFLSYGLGWNSGFSATNIDNSAGTASMQTGVEFLDPAVTETLNAILLGTFRFTGVAAGTSFLTLRDADPLQDDTLVDDPLAYTVLDGIITFGATTSITVNGVAAVPEPSGVLAFLLTAGVLTWRSRRNRSAPIGK